MLCGQLAGKYPVYSGHLGFIQAPLVVGRAGPGKAHRVCRRLREPSLFRDFASSSLSCFLGVGVLFQPPGRRRDQPSGAVRHTGVRRLVFLCCSPLSPPGWGGGSLALGTWEGTMSHLLPRFPGLLYPLCPGGVKEDTLSRVHVWAEERQVPASCPHAGRSCGPRAPGTPGGPGTGGGGGFGMRGRHEAAPMSVTGGGKGSGEQPPGR